MLLSNLIRIVELWISAHSASKDFWTARSSFALMRKSILLRSHCPDVESDSKWLAQPSFETSIMTVYFGIARSVFVRYLIACSFRHLISWPHVPSETQCKRLCNPLCFLKALSFSMCKILRKHWPYSTAVEWDSKVSKNSDRVWTVRTAT